MTMMQGMVEQVSQKDVSTKFGVKPTFSLKVDGSWVKCGFKNPKANVGDEVQFDGESGAYGMEAKNVVVTAKGAGVPPVVAGSVAVKAPAYSGGYKDKVFPVPPLHGDRSIIRQNSLARATEIIIAAYGGKSFTFDDGLLDLAIKTARKFEAYSAGDLDLAEAKQDIKDEKGE